MLQDKTVVVTGGTGSLGKVLVRRLLSGELGQPKKVVVFSRDDRGVGRSDSLSGCRSKGRCKRVSGFGRAGWLRFLSLQGGYSLCYEGILSGDRLIGSHYSGSGLGSRSMSSL